MTAERPLDASPLRRALGTLVDLLEASGNADRMAMLSEVERLGIRAGAIKHFEMAYELCWKMAVRWLDANVAEGVAQGLARRQLYRLAADHRLISDVDTWMRYHEARNETVHVYDEAKAAEVHLVVGEFVPDARALLAALEAAP